MGHKPKLHVQLSRDGDHVHIRRGNLYTFSVRKEEAAELCNHIIDLIEGQS